jgi:predicted branched-subunit amino acid permease
MGSIGVISLPSFLVSHDFLLTTFGFIIFLTGLFLAVVSYFLSKSEQSEKSVLLGASVGFLGSLLPPVDVFLILGAILIFLSLRRSDK